MKTLLVGFDNPTGANPLDALLPTDTVGALIRSMIANHVGHEYTDAMYLRDFYRTNLYALGRATNGPGRRRADLEKFVNVCWLASNLEIDNVVLFGNRNREAFNLFYEDDITWLQSSLIGKPSHRCFWTLPTPARTNRWYHDPDNLRAAGRLLSELRARQHITHCEST